ncbi:MAG: hypothetical protein COX61_01935 [Candidatus Brennerbacteria bacterium CG_4_10_14_0_2_um_filter_43_14]|nr:MAG: hypothetical protein COX61_01935 [Candidatus Brennerbacteria bacterium CG_4_10_14_0_2_um_filter_43_14]
MDKIIIHTDGGSRGNPGPSAIGVVIDLGARGIKEYAEFLGRRTNNEAEYEAIVFALKKTKALIGKEKASRAHIVVRTDSELAGSQLRGEFKIMEQSFYPLFIAIWNLKQDFKQALFETIPREKNKRADTLVNRALNAELKPSKLF